MANNKKYYEKTKMIQFVSILVGKLKEKTLQPWKKWKYVGTKKSQNWELFSIIGKDEVYTIPPKRGAVAEFTLDDQARNM